MKRLTNEKVKFLVTLAICYCILGTAIPVAIDSNNYIYGVEQLHMFDNSLFQANPAIGMGGYTPRIFMNLTVSFLMKHFHLQWEQVVVLFIYINLFPYAFALTNLVFRLFKQYRLLLVSAASIFLLFNITSGLGMYGMFGISSIGTGALGISFAAISFVVGREKKWTRAWLIQTAAVMIHIHDGLYGGGGIAFNLDIRMPDSKKTAALSFEKICYLYYSLIILYFTRFAYRYKHIN